MLNLAFINTDKNMDPENNNNYGSTMRLINGLDETLD